MSSEAWFNLPFSSLCRSSVEAPCFYSFFLKNSRLGGLLLPRNYLFHSEIFDLFDPVWKCQARSVLPMRTAIALQPNPLNWLTLTCARFYSFFLPPCRRVDICTWGLPPAPVRPWVWTWWAKAQSAPSALSTPISHACRYVILVPWLCPLAQE